MLCRLAYFIDRTLLQCSNINCQLLVCAVQVCAVLVCAVLVCAVLVCAVLVCAVLVCAELVCAVLVCAVLICAALVMTGNVFEIICIPDNERVIKASTIYLLYLVLFACFVLAPLEGVIEARGGGPFVENSMFYKGFSAI